MPLGRPRYGELPRIPVSVSLPLEVVQWLGEEADRRRQNRSEVILSILEAHIAQKGAKQ